MWIVACREYAEDPAFFSLVSPTVLSARRTTIYVFFDRGPGQPLEQLTLGGDSNGGLYTVYRDPDAANREIYGDAVAAFAEAGRPAASVLAAVILLRFTMLSLVR